MKALGTDREIVRADKNLIKGGERERKRARVRAKKIEAV